MVTYDERMVTYDERIIVAVKVRFQSKRVLASQNAFWLEFQSERVLTEIFSQSAFSS